MKHKVLGYTFIAVALAAAVSVLYYVEVRDRTAEAPVLPIHQDSAESLITYQNSEYGFQISYEKNYLPDDSGAGANYFKNPGQTAVSISIPKALYPDTNFSSALATVAVQTESSQGPCERATVTKTINGVVFHESETDGAALGTRYQTRLYRTFKDGNCYEISLTLGTANMGNFEPGAVGEVDDGNVWQRLTAIAETFKFKGAQEAVGLKTYRNEEYGFELQIPKDWKVEKKAAGDSLRLTFISDKTRALFASPDFTEGLSGDMFFSNKSYMDKALPNTDSLQVINGLSFTVYLGGPTVYDGLNYEIKNQGRVYVFSAGYLADIEGILATLKFIE